MKTTMIKSGCQFTGMCMVWGWENWPAWQSQGEFLQEGNF